MARESCEDGNGGLKLPIGFRFHPTDEELLVHYLKRKVYSLPLPATVIPDLEIFQSNPWDLPGELKEKKYFFCKRKKNFRNKCSLSTDCGYWRPTGRDKQITAAPGTNLLIGIRKSFVFYQRGNNSSKFTRTQWILQEFCLVGSINTPYLAQKLMIQVGDWVVCRVYQRNKKRARNQGKVANEGKKSRASVQQGIQAHDCIGQITSSPSCSSGVTEISGNELDDQEESSHNVTNSGRK